MAPTSIPILKPFTDQEPPEWRRDQVLLRTDCYTIKILYSSSFLRASPKEVYDLWLWRLCQGERTHSDCSGITGHCLWTDPNSRKLKMSLWSTSQNRGSQVIGGVLVHSLSQWVLKPATITSAGLECLSGIDILSNWPNPFIGSND